MLKDVDKRQCAKVAAVSLALAASLLLTASPALAAFPDKFINLIIPYPAGGTTDIAARAMVPYLEKYLGGKIIIINKGGAGGEIGFREIAKATPDGYTIGFINTPNVVTIPIERNARYKIEDFATLGNIVGDPCAIAVNPNSKFKTLADVIAYAKEHPGEVTYGTTGVGSDDHFAALEIERKYGVKLTHVPFPGGAGVRTALAGGHIQLGIYNIGEMLGEVRQGLVRTLGIMTDKRWEDAPEIPTFKEQGYELNISSERGLAGPAGLSADIRARYVDAIAKTMKDPGFVEFARRHPLPLMYLDDKDYAAMLSKMRDSYEKRWRESPWAGSTN
jgi:putative tricarboxylic transport membrane protein